ncbi:MAG: hypothetical protein ABF535_11810, partial [Acetobacter sp.]
MHALKCLAVGGLLAVQAMPAIAETTPAPSLSGPVTADGGATGSETGARQTPHAFFPDGDVGAGWSTPADRTVEGAAAGPQSSGGVSSPAGGAAAASPPVLRRAPLADPAVATPLHSRSASPFRPIGPLWPASHVVAPAPAVQPPQALPAPPAALPQSPLSVPPSVPVPPLSPHPRPGFPGGGSQVASTTPSQPLLQPPAAPIPAGPSTAQP